MTPEEIRKIIDELKKRHKKHNGRYKTGDEYRIYFYTELFNLLSKK